MRYRPDFGSQPASESQPATSTKAGRSPPASQRAATPRPRRKRFVSSSPQQPSLAVGLLAMLRSRRFPPAHALAQRPPQVSRLWNARGYKRRVRRLPPHLAAQSAYSVNPPPFLAQLPRPSMQPLVRTAARRTRGPRIEPRKRHPTPPSPRTGRPSRMA